MMADRDRISRLEYDVAGISRQIAGMPVRLGKGAGTGIGEHFQLIRGQTTAAVTPIAAAFQITSVAEFEQHAKTPATPTGVAAPPGGVTLADGDYVWAAYHKAFTTFDFGSGTVDVDWVMIPTAEGQSTPPLRRFEVVTAFDKIDTTASVKWLDYAGSMVGDPVTVHDPDQQFHGRAANYVSGERGFWGIALLRADLAEEDPLAPRWEIVACEGFSETVVAQWAGSPDNEWQLDSFSGDQWERRRPVADAAPLTISDPLSFPSPAGGDKRIFHLYDPDTDPPTYQVRTVKQDDRKVASGTSDTAPATLIEKLDNVDAFNGANDRIVRFEEFDDGGTRKVRAHVDVSDLGGGGGEVDEGYCIDLVGSTVHHDAITAGAGVQATGIDTTKQQFWVHFAGASARTDAKWKSVTNYVSSGTTAQLLVNIGDVWDWKLLTDYDEGVSNQIFGQDAGTWKAKSLLAVLNGHLTVELRLLPVGGPYTELEVRLKVDGTEISQSSVPVGACP